MLYRGDNRIAPGSTFIGLDRRNDFPEIQRPKQCTSPPAFSRTPNMHNESLLSTIGESKIDKMVDSNPLMKNLFPLKDGKKIFIAPQINFFSLSIPGIGLGQPPMRLNQQVVNNTQYMNQQSMMGTANNYNTNVGYQSAPGQTMGPGNMGGFQNTGYQNTQAGAFGQPGGYGQPGAYGQPGLQPGQMQGYGAQPQMGMGQGYGQQPGQAAMGQRF